MKEIWPSRNTGDRKTARLTTAIGASKANATTAKRAAQRGARAYRQARSCLAFENDHVLRRPLAQHLVAHGHLVTAASGMDFRLQLGNADIDAVLHDIPDIGHMPHAAMSAVGCHANQRPVPVAGDVDTVRPDDNLGPAAPQACVAAIHAVSQAHRALRFDHPVQHVGAADEIGDEQRGGPLVDILGRASCASRPPAITPTTSHMVKAST